MFKAIRNNLFAVLLSIGVHVVLLLMLFLSFESTPKLASVQSQPNVVKATVVDASKVQAELDKLKRAEKKKHKKEQARIDKLKRAERDAKKRRAVEEKRIAELKKKRAVAEKRRAQEQKKLAKVKKEKAALEEKRKAEQKQLAELEKKRKVEQEKQKKVQAERKVAEAKHKAAEKKRKLAEAKRRETERKKQLAAQLEAEEQERNETAAQSEINKYQALIRQKVTRNWLRPAGARKGLACTVRVRTIPGGEVVGVIIIKGSGNAVFDRSVESAVRKAAPLPLPRDPAVAARMREIDFEFIPEA